MSTNCYDRAGEIFLEASQLQGDEQEAYVREACGGDAKLLEEVMGLLAHDSVGAKLLPTETGEGSHPLASSSFKDGTLERLGRYQIMEILGQGGMGVVYRAEQESPRRQVALKVIRPEGITAAARKRFGYEVRILGRLQHPGIAQIHEAGEAETPLGSQPFFAMELVDGKPLLEYVTEYELTMEQRLTLFAQVCDAVQHAHQQGIIHRDLKPANILIDTQGQPKVLDFGVAKSTDADLETTSMTAQGQLIGTVAYMSPEQASGRPELIDTRSDVYALGVVLYELIAGQLPYGLQGKHLHEAIRIIREDDPTPLSSVERTFRGDVEIIVAKALEKEKERRYASAEKLADDVRRFLKDEPIIARRASTWYQLRKFSRRHRVLVGGVLTTILALAIGMTLFAWKAGDERVARGLAETNAQRAKDAERRVLTVSGIPRVDELIGEIDTLWPRRPETVAAYESWLARATTLGEQLSAYRDDLEAHREERSSTVDGEVTFTTYEDEWLDRNLSSMIERIETIREGTSAHAAIASRLEIARTIEEKTIDDYEEEWERVIQEIAESDLYEEVDLEPEIGLVPLGKNEESRLQEFWVWETGERPRRGDNGRFEMTGNSGMVLVLLPGGEATIGAWPVTGNHVRGTPHVDIDADPNEGPPQTVFLDPFFVSKYEVTQGQWMRLIGENPSRYSGGGGESHPVERIAWADAMECARRLGMVLPTEARWEYAARAGSTAVFSSGDDYGSLQGHANIADACFIKNGGNADWSTPGVDDGFAAHAPVGMFQPNAYGVHDVHGNVWEWCLDAFVSGDARDGDGLRAFDANSERGSIRGGSFNAPAQDARAANRYLYSRANEDGDLGVRLVRELTR